MNSNVVTVSITVNEVVAGILINPSFESDFNGWASSGNQSIAYYPADDGIKLVAFNGDNRTPNGVLSQAFATTPGQMYSLSFATGLLAYTTDSQVLQVTVDGSGTLLTQTVTMIGKGAGLEPWIPQSFTFMANSATTTLTFRDQSVATFGIDLLLDHVRVVGIAAPTTLLTTTNPGDASMLAATPTLSGAPGAFAIRMTAPQDGTYVLQRSSDLQSWEAVGSMECAAQQLIEFYDNRDLSAAGAPETRMFYRIGLQPDQSNQ